MKKIISLLVIFVTLLCGITNSYAISWASVEKMSEDDEPMLPRFGEFASQGYIFEMNGKTYIIGGQRSRYHLPIELNSRSEEIWAGQYYMLRHSGYDEWWSMRGVPRVPIKFYDRDGNLVYEHTFDRNVCATGYFNHYYYCKLFDTWKVYKSADMVNWEETEEDIPRQTEQLTYAGDAVSFDGSNMIAINYEYSSEKDFLSTMGDWIVKIDENYSIYLSNDNIYFAKIDMPYCEIDHKDTFSIHTCESERLHKKAISSCELRCIYEYNDNIVIEIKTTPWVEYWRLMVPKQDIYDELEQQKSAPYVKYNNTILGFEQPPIIQNDRTLIPIRFLFEQMGAEVTWNGEEQTATISQDNTAITFAIDATEADVNGQTVSMEIPAQLINDKTMVPVRFLSEALGYTVNWDGDTRIITIE